MGNVNNDWRFYSVKVFYLNIAIWYVLLKAIQPASIGSLWFYFWFMLGIFTNWYCNTQKAKAEISRMEINVLLVEI